MNRVKELYERLIEYYSSFYVLPTVYLERRIADLQRLGYSREGAIIKLYEEIFGKVEVKVERLRPQLYKEKKPEVKVMRRGILDLLSYSYNAYTHNLCLALPVILKDSISYTSSVLIFIIALYALNEAFKLGISLRVRELSEVQSLLSLLQKNVYTIIIVGMLLLFVLVLIRVIASSIYWSTIISSSLKLYEHKRVALKDIISGLSLLSRVFRAELVAEFIRISGFIPLLTLIVYMFVNLKTLLSFPFSFLMTILTVLLMSLISLVAHLILFMFTVYVPHEVIVGNKGVLGSILGSFRIFRKSWRQVILYVILWLVTLFCAGIVSGVFELVHISLYTLVSFIVTAIVIPILDISLTGVYLQYMGWEIKLWSKPGRVLETLKNYIRDSLRVLSNFIKGSENIPFITIAMVMFMTFYALGIHLGNTQFTPLMSRIVRPGELSSLLKKIVPFSLALEIFFNNWKVAMTSSLGGLFHVVPLLATSINGLMLGLVTSRLKLMELLILIMPHGCIELPAFILAVAAGIKFSFITMVKRAKVSETLKETTLIAIGLAIPLIIAAFIEAFVTPQLARILLGWS